MAQPYNRQGRTKLAFSAVVPIVLVLGLNALAHSYWWWGSSLLLGSLLVAVWILAQMSIARRDLPSDSMPIKKVKVADREMLSFILAMLIPFMRKDPIGYDGEWTTIASVLVIVWLAIYFSNGFTFNPLLSIWGYYFYEIEDSSGIVHLLISRRILHNCDHPLIVKHFADFIYLEADYSDAQDSPGANAALRRPEAPVRRAPNAAA